MKLKQFLKTNKNARKVFGKKEIEIIIKQLEGLKLTQSEKNRLCRDVKPKLEFIKEAIKFKDEFNLVKNQDNKRIMDKAVQIILRDKPNKNISAILLFGSFADNSFTKRSDIDICAVFKEDISLKKATEFRIHTSGQLPKKVDIQVFNILPQKIKKGIARNHKILYKGKDYDNINFS